MRVILGTWGRLFVRDDPEAVYIDFFTQKVWRNNVAAQLTVSQIRLAAALLSRGGGQVLLYDIFGIMYGDREDGGPDLLKRTLDQFLLKVRRALLPLGIKIRTEWGYGFTAEIVPPADYQSHPLKGRKSGDAPYHLRL